MLKQLYEMRELYNQHLKDLERMRKPLSRQSDEYDLVVQQMLSIINAMDVNDARITLEEEKQRIDREKKLNDTLKSLTTYDELIQFLENDLQGYGLYMKRTGAYVTDTFRNIDPERVDYITDRDYVTRSCKVSNLYKYVEILSDFI